MLFEEKDISSFLITPPDTNRPNPPVKTLQQSLPIGELSWENFERLCYRLVDQQNEVEHASRYGLQGEAQAGIDIFARLSSGRYHCWQAKRHKKYNATQLKDAVDLFLKGEWAMLTNSFTLAVHAPLQSTTIQREIEKQVRRCKTRGISFEAVDSEELSKRLREYPSIVDDFFGRPWVEAFLGEDVSQALGARLDGGEFARCREQLSGIYEAQFHQFDPGGFGTISEADGTLPLTLLDRFEVPDIMVREHHDLSTEPDEYVRGHLAADSPHLSERARVITETQLANFSGEQNRSRRLSSVDWVKAGERFVLLGEAGSGKSTMLRVIALEILSQNECTVNVVPGWKHLLPIYIPFSRWVSQVEQSGNAISLSDMVRLNLQPLMTASLVKLIDRAIDERRILLLIDGLDEWANEQAARITLAALVTLVETHNLSAVVSGRPRGTDKIGSIPVGWIRGTIAPLSSNQQTAIASRWFLRHVSGSSPATQVVIAEQRTLQFSREIARDQNLSIIATVPLLLVGLVTLALRGQMLPRTKPEIYNQLVKVLLELHPVNRASAAGDTRSRFRHSDDPDQRRAAIASLAFHLRLQTGGGSLTRSSARKILGNYLTDQEGYALTPFDAAELTKEILAVNSETQGLIIEKSPDEFGFVHASFEEYLSAEYLAGLPFNDIEEFVRQRASDSRWRNTIVHLLGGLARRDEIDRLIDSIWRSNVEMDEYSEHHRNRLLDDVAVAIVSRAPQTALKLIKGTIARIENEDWMPARRSALASLLASHTDHGLLEITSHHISRWFPARAANRSALLDALGNWEPSEDLCHVLWRAMHDEDRYVQRSAAAAFARTFGGTDNARAKVIEGLSRTRDLGHATALLECLALGWKEDEGLLHFYQEAASKHTGDMQVAGILGLAQLDHHTRDMGKTLLYCSSFWSETSYPYRELAKVLLLRYWHDDNDLIASALGNMQNRYHSYWENDVAIAFLMETATDRVDVRHWIIQELSEEFPFNATGGERLWEQVGRFAQADPEIRAAANAFWRDQKRRLVSMHAAQHYVARIADTEVADALVAELAEEGGVNKHWALTALLEGWGREHPDVQKTLTALAAQPDEKLYDFAAHLPALMKDQKQARDRLLRMSVNPELRRDLLALGLKAAGCDGSDEDAVSAILAGSGQVRHIFDPAVTLFAAFSANHRVRELAKQRISIRHAPISSIATAYPADPELKDAVFAAAIPLPIELRAQCVEAASRASAETALTRKLNEALYEVDSDLRVQMTIANCEYANQSTCDVLERELLEAATATGPDYTAVRAAALAGLVTLDRLSALVNLTEGDKPVRLSTSGHFKSIPTIERLICKQLATLESSFGNDFHARISSFNQQSLSSILCTAPNASPAARRAFLELAEQDKLPKNLRAVSALAEIKPKSNLLLDACFAVLGTGDRNNRSALINAEIGQILQEQFPDNASVRDRLAQQNGIGTSVATSIALAVYDPKHPALPKFPFSEQIQGQFGVWAFGATLAATSFSTDTFCKFVEAMLMRSGRHEFDAQQFTNRAIINRLREDEKFVAWLEGCISIEAPPCVAGGAARYLVAAGRLGPEGRQRINSLLITARDHQKLPVAGYDPIADKWRALRTTLLDALAGAAEAR